MSTDKDEARRLHPVTFLDRGEVPVENEHIKDFRARFKKIEKDGGEPVEQSVAEKANRK